MIDRLIDVVETARGQAGSAADLQVLAETSSLFAGRQSVESGKWEGGYWVLSFCPWIGSIGYSKLLASALSYVR